jgi:mRNA interferase MazF
MSLPKLICPHDASHIDFRGRIRAFANFNVELDQDWNVLKRGDPTDVVDASDASDDSIYCVRCKVEIWRKARAVTFLPAEGAILVCDFSTGFRLPEMIERRPCIVISQTRTNRGLCVVVPISSRESIDREAIVVPMPMAKYPFLRKDGWAKCHAPATVGKSRLYMMRDPVTNRGLDSRKTMIDAADLAAVRLGVARFIGAIDGPS